MRASILSYLFLRRAVPVGLLTVLLLPHSIQAAATTQYTFNELISVGVAAGIIPPARGFSIARDISNDGTIVGRSSYSTLTLLEPGKSHATLWAGTNIADLGVNLLTLDNEASAINSSGVAVGYTGAGVSTNAIKFSNGISLILPALSSSHTNTRALALNNNGIAVGYSGVGSSVSLESPVFWSGQSVTILPTLGGLYGRATSINDAGTIVGYSATPGNSVSRATIWNNGVASDLGTLGGAFSLANSINNAGAVVGRSTLAGNASGSAAIWNDGKVVNLGTLGGSWSEALDLNNSGQVVGYAYTLGNAAIHASIWQNGSVIDLNDYVSNLPAGLVLTHASAINDEGIIIGQATYSLSGRNTSFVLTPVSAVPETGRAALLLCGLICLGLVSKMSSRWCLRIVGVRVFSFPRLGPIGRAATGEV